jgi:hypothetical protein
MQLQILLVKPPLTPRFRVNVSTVIIRYIYKTNKLRGFSPPANYTDRATGYIYI